MAVSRRANFVTGPRLLAPADLQVLGDGKVTFEEDVTCGQNVRIFADGREIRIGARAWLGDNAQIRASVGANSIVASDSVVVEDTPANFIVSGSPAKHIWDIC